jgi:hypothetical protein
LTTTTFNIDVNIFNEVVTNGLIAAYEKGYTQANALANQASNIYPATVGTALGLPADFMKNAVAAVGNINEIWKRHFGLLSPGLSDLPAKGGVYLAFP